MPQEIDRKLLREQVEQPSFETEQSIMNEIFTTGGNWCGLQTSTIKVCKIPDKSQVIFWGSSTVYGADQPAWIRTH